MNERRVRRLGTHGQPETGFGSKGVRMDVDTSGLGQQEMIPCSLW
jgi:hypothetical protein